MNLYFITGTDTDCGKTYATSKIAEYLFSLGKKVKALKPVASGCSKQDGNLTSEDALRLQAINRKHFIVDDYLTNICPWSFEEPIAPHIAAKRSNIKLSAKEIADFCTDKKHDFFDTILIEGAGGLLVPLNEHETWIDVIKLTKAKVILIVGMRLGCINHALLTMTALQAHAIPCAGWIANCVHHDMPYLTENIETLISRVNAPFLGTIPFAGELKINSLIAQSHI